MLAPPRIASAKRSSCSFSAPAAVATSEPALSIDACGSSETYRASLQCRFPTGEHNPSADDPGTGCRSAATPMERRFRWSSLKERGLSRGC
jgi:hypothetical protein